MAFTKTYLTSQDAPYTPATLRGAWDDTGAVVTKALDPTPFTVETQAVVSRAETDTGGDYDILLYRGVSGPLSAQTISGTVNVLIPVAESWYDLNAHWHLHLYVTQGDSDTPRGTLLTDYTEAAGTNEWVAHGTAGYVAGKALNSAQTLSSLAISDGDRLVVEVGCVARNTTATSLTAKLGYGRHYGWEATASESADNVFGSPYLVFSNSISEPTPVLESRVTQVGVELIDAQTGQTNVTQVGVELIDAQTGQTNVTQVGVELIDSQTGQTNVTQVGVELIIRTVHVWIPFIASTAQLYPPSIPLRLPFIDDTPDGLYPPEVEISAGLSVVVPFIDDTPDTLYPPSLTQPVYEIRVTQAVTETVNQSAGTVRVTQAVAEYLDASPSSTRVTQVVVEYVNPTPTTVRVSQVAVEYIRPTPLYTCGPPTVTMPSLCRVPVMYPWIEWGIR